VGDTIDHQAAGATDAFPAVVIKGNRDLAPLHQPLVQNIEHLEERHVRADLGGVVLDEAAWCGSARLAPDP
jgi:hypothetical protein